MILPSLLTPLDLPEAELRSMRLDGEIYALAEGWCAIGEFDDARQRAAAVRGTRSRRLIAELGTAAWVWGARVSLPQLLEFCVGLDARARPAPSSALQIRELVLEPADVVEWPDGAVATPLRTAVDLARFRSEVNAEDEDAISMLAAIGRFGLRECEALLDRRRNLPGKRVARERLTRVLSPR